MQHPKQNPVWHPCSQMKDYEAFPPLEIVGAEGPYLHLEGGSRLIDAISSWWCKSLGHGHPRLRAALQEQAGSMEHVILANTSNQVIRDCSRSILGLSAAHDKVFYASDGSCAVEIAVKMAVHAQQLMGNPQRTGLLALQNGYHGETALTLSLSDLGLYKDPYESLCQPVEFIGPLPEVLGPHDPAWNESPDAWAQIESALDDQLDSVAAIVVEPIVQGAGGMKIYHPDVLRGLRRLADQHGILLIADEIMTGVGRTGKTLACEHAGIHADLVCLSKGLTAGWLPFSAVLVPDRIYDLFYDDYETGKAFLHSHTYTGNALGARVTTECLNVVREEGIVAQSVANGELMRRLMQELADDTGMLGPVRQVGSVVASELQLSSPVPRAGYQVYRKAVELGALLRPLGNTIYWTPPLNTPEETLYELQEVTAKALHQAF